MKIGIDIDDTIVDTYSSMIKYADIYNEKILGRKNTKKEIGNIETSRYLDVLYKWDKKTKFEYFDMYYKNVLEECTILPEVSKILQELKKEKCEIYFVTARVSGIKNCDTEELTKKTLIENNIPYNKLIIDADDKVKYCKEYGIEYFIDDSYITLKNMNESNIKTYLMTTKLNQNLSINPQIQRVNNWSEFYKKIHLK